LYATRFLPSLKHPDEYQYVLKPNDATSGINFGKALINTVTPEPGFGSWLNCKGMRTLAPWVNPYYKLG